jgi:hypothetical protein
MEGKRRIEGVIEVTTKVKFASQYLFAVLLIQMICDLRIR